MEQDKYFSSFQEEGDLCDLDSQETVVVHLDPRPGSPSEEARGKMGRKSQDIEEAIPVAEVYAVQPEDLEEVDPSLAEFAIPVTQESASSSGEVEKAPEDRPELPKEGIRDRIRGRPELLVPAGGVLVAVLLIGSAMCGSKSPDESRKAGQDRPEFPRLETPEVRDKPFEREEVERLLLEADKKEAARKRNARAISANLVGVSDPERMERPKPLPPKAQDVPLFVRPLPRYVHQEAPAEPAPTEAVQADSERIRERILLAGYLKPGTIKVEEGSDNPKASIQAGATFKVKLQVGVNTTFHGTAVLARVVEPVRDSEGRSVLPASATLQGDFRGSGDRVLLSFHTALVGEKKIPIKAYAVQGGLPGLKAKVIKKKSAGSGRATKAVAGGGVGLLRAATSLVGGMASPAGAQIVDNMTRDGLQDLDREARGSESGNGLENNALELPAGLVFEVVSAG
jgi:hypothetical protein